MTARRPTWMAGEIAAQPHLLACLITDWDANQERIRAVLPAHLQGVTFVARGSSDNVAMIGRYAVELGSGLPAGLAAPSLRTRYPVRRGLPSQLIVALSQSGQVPEVVQAARSLCATGSRLIAITNHPDSPLAAAADLTLALGTGPERAVQATKTVTAQILLTLAVASTLATVFGDGCLLARPQLDAVPDAVAAIVADTDAPQRLAARWHHSDRLLVIGRGLTYGAMLEAALKIRETAGILAQGISSADLVHGPIAALSPGIPVLAVAAGGPADPEPQLCQRVRDTGADIATCAPDADADLPLPPELCELLQSIAVTVRGQQLAHAWALALGRDPDAPAGLSKLTVTR